MRWAGVVALLGLACAPAAHPTPMAPRIFARLGCNDCHAVSGLGVRSRHDVGPDLTFAYSDVMTRYGVSLEAFLANPTGVMRLMLGAHLKVTAADRDSLVTILRALHVEHRAAADYP